MAGDQKIRKILIVDDEEDICTIFKDILMEYSDRSGYHVDYATSAKAAYAFLNSQDYDLIFVDIKLKGSINGLDIIKECEKLVRRPKILIISAMPHKLMDEAIREKGIERLVEKYLEKKDDLLPEKVIRVINNIFDKYDEGPL